MITAADVKQRFPALHVIERTPHELEIANPARAHQRLKVVLPHADVHAEATATWADSKQTIRVQGGVGQVVETSKWADEPETWTVAFDTWVDAWLVLLAGGAPGPVRPGHGA